MDQRRWVRAAVIVLVVVLVGSVVVALTSVAGQQSQPGTNATDSIDPAGGPSLADLDVLAADLSSGDRTRILGSLADIPIEQGDRALQALGDLTAVTFDPETVRFDAENQAALVDVDITATDGSTQSERVVLVERAGRWLIFSTLQQPGATAIPTDG